MKPCEASHWFPTATPPLTPRNNGQESNGQADFAACRTGYPLRSARIAVGPARTPAPGPPPRPSLRPRLIRARSPFKPPAQSSPSLREAGRRGKVGRIGGCHSDADCRIVGHWRVNLVAVGDSPDMASAEERESCFGTRPARPGTFVRIPVHPNTPSWKTARPPRDLSRFPPLASPHAAQFLDSLSKHNRHMLFRARVFHRSDHVLGAQRLQVFDRHRALVAAMLGGNP